MQRLVERAEKVESDAKATLLRTTVAADKKLPPFLASRLLGDTEEELTTDADKLLAGLAQASPTDDAAAPPQPSPVPAMDQRVRSTTGGGQAAVTGDRDLWRSHHPRCPVAKISSAGDIPLRLAGPGRTPRQGVLGCQWGTCGLRRTATWPS